MPDVPDIPRPSQLWKRLSPERKLLAADAFWQDENAGAEQAEAIVMIAQRIKFRTRSVQVLPREKKSRHLVTSAAYRRWSRPDCSSHITCTISGG
jgi:hypothetical protein